MFKLVLVIGLACHAMARPQYNYDTPVTAPAAPPSNLYDQPSASPPQPDYGPSQAASNDRPHTKDAPGNGEGMPYELDWGVEDEESSNSFSHVESSDGDTTQGEYRVLLPDGRTQVVKFFDNGGGYNAEVTYEKK